MDIFQSAIIIPSIGSLIKEYLTLILWGISLLGQTFGCVE